MSATGIGAVVIGRNEGERLRRCLASLRGRVARVVYVDSGSHDGSPEAALELGAEVLPLETDAPFTAARARNAGFARLAAGPGAPAFVQFVDGDCEVQPGWIETALGFLETHPGAAVACGRRRERFPAASVWNRLVDAEWDTPVGEAKACGGDALMRTAALAGVGGYDPRLIAGEEPELCLRLRRAGWTVWRLDAEMTLHDAALTRFSQWWQRARRAGYAAAEAAAMYGTGPERHGVRPLASALAWGLALPLMALAGALVASPWLLLLLLAFPAQVVRLGMRSGDWTRALFLVLGKLPEAQGALTWAWRRLGRARPRLIEYK
jgi:GT2 family glycosyltransferase